MKKLIIIPILFICFFVTAQISPPIDSVHYAVPANVVSPHKADSLTALMVRLGSTYSNPSWITALAWSKITGAPSFGTGTVTSIVPGWGHVSSATITTTGSLPIDSSSTGVQTKAGINRIVPNVITKSANYSITSADFVVGHTTELIVWVDCTSGSVTLTLPSASTFAAYTIKIGKIDNTANVLTLSGLSADNKMQIQNSLKEIISANGNWTNN